MKHIYYDDDQKEMKLDSYFHFSFMYGLSLDTDAGTAYLKDGRITIDYVSDNLKLLISPSKMTPRELCEACNYCKTIDNPYTEELCRRAGNADKFVHTKDMKEKRKALENAAKSFGIGII